MHTAQTTYTSPQRRSAGECHRELRAPCTQAKAHRDLLISELKQKIEASGGS